MNKRITKYVAGTLVGATLATGGYFIGRGSAKKDTNSISNPEQTDTLLENNDTIIQIEEREVLTEEKFDDLCANFAKILEDKEINADLSDIVKFVTIVNIDQLAEDNETLLKTLLGNQAKEEYLGDAFKIISVAMNYNYRAYASDQNTDNFVRFSEAIFDKSAKEDLLLFESYADELSKENGNAEIQNKIIESFIDDLYTPNGALINVEDGVGMASVLAVDEMANYLSFTNYVCQLTDENRGILINYTSAEQYISNIFENMENCLGETRTR